MAVPRPHGWRGWLGVSLIVVGLSLLGYVGWQLYGTNLVSQRHQREIVAGLREQWRQSHDEATVDGVRSVAIVHIPRFGREYAVPVLQGVGTAQLASGFGHFEQTARVGQVGNYALAAHRVTHGQPLREMPELQPGDRIVVETRTRVYTYVLDTGGDDLTVPFTAGWVVATKPVNPDGGVGPVDDDRLLTLTTCSELFHTDNRLVAFGHLASVRTKRSSAGR